MINIKVKGLNELLEYFGKLNVEKALGTGVKKSIFHLQGETIKVTPIDTGFLRNGNYLIYGLDPLQGQLVNIRKYGYWVHEGREDGRLKARPFMTDTAEKENNEVNLIFNREIIKMINIL